MDESPAGIWNHLPVQTKLIVLGSCLFPLLSLLGLLFAHREHNEAALPLALVMLFFPLVFYITHASTRYRHPMDPVMLVLAVYGLMSPISYLLKRSSGLHTHVPASDATD